MYIIPANTLSRPSDFLNKKPAYIFHHLMKCGGSSIAYNLKFWFNIIYDHLISIQSIEDYKKNKIEVNSIGSDYCIIGHYAYEGIHLFQRYPELIEERCKIKAFTFIRDPLMFNISFYYYTKNSGRTIQNSLSDFINDNQNLYAYYFPCTEENFHEILDKYFFIGITERMQESFDVLAELINKKKFKVPVLNTTKKDFVLSILSEEFINKFKEKNELDYKIYNYCNKKLEEFLNKKNISEKI